MVFLTTAKNVASVFAANPVSEDDVVVFYKDGDSVKMSDIQMLLNYKVSLIPVDDRDDMLIFLGGWFVTNEGQVTVVDSTIPMPKRYADRIVEVKSKPAPKRRNPRKIVKKTEDVSPVTETTDISTDMSGMMNPPEASVTEEKTDTKKKELTV